MSPEIAEQIFEPFFTTKPRDSGTGLGLSTVYGIVKQAGGYIYVDTAPDAGTTFRVYLPVIGAETIIEAPVAPERESHTREVDGATVLVVEDEAAVRRLVERILWGNGYTILSASSGQEALEFVTKYGFDIDLLITDVVMPGISGRELATRLTALRPDVGVLYMSGYSDDIVGRHGLDPGEPFLQKPFTAEELKDAVRNMLISDRALA
jgi:CheY-like chemotaxis protein